MDDGSERRPDGRAATAATTRLRVANRALRNHLDALPVDYDLAVSGDRFLAGLAFMFARQRYDCTDSLIGAGLGGPVMGAIARSLFVDGLRWLWISEQPDRRRTLLGDLLKERNRLCMLIEQADVTCPILSRWLMPLPNVADLSGQSLAWLDAPPMPSEDDLLNGVLHRGSGAALVPNANPEHGGLIGRARTLLEMGGLRGATLILDYAGHGNLLGMLSSVTEDGAIGHDLRADHEALFLHIAAAGVTATLLGTSTAIPEQWPKDVDRGPFLQEAVDLTVAVAAAAEPIHGLRHRARAEGSAKPPGISRDATSILRPGTIVTEEEWLPDVNSAEQVRAAAEEYFGVAMSIGFDIWANGDPGLHVAVAYGGGHSLLHTVMTTYDKPESAVIAVFAARMLLEEAARLNWRFAEPSEGAFKARAKQYFDEYRARRKKAIDLMISAGVPLRRAHQLFDLPKNVHPASNDGIAKGRAPLPTIASMLRQLGRPFPEPGWLEVAYSLLSQVTHSTPLGHLHAVRVRDGVWHGNELSTEMLGLTLDIACAGSALLIGHSALVLTDLGTEAIEYRTRLLRAAVNVHDAARLVHGLD